MSCFLPHKMKRTVEWFLFFSPVCWHCSASAPADNTLPQVEGNCCFLMEYFSNQQEQNVLFNWLICSFISRLFLSLQMDGSFSELINLPGVFNKIIVVIIAQWKLFKSLFFPRNAAAYVKTSKESMMMSKIYQMHTRVNWFYLDDWYLKEFKWHKPR